MPRRFEPKNWQGRSTMKMRNEIEHFEDAAQRQNVVAAGIGCGTLGTYLPS